MIDESMNESVTKVFVEQPRHLCFKQAQPKMGHSPKVDDGVHIFLKLLEHLFSDHFVKEL